MIRMEARSFARSGSKVVARLRSTDAKSLALKARTDGFQQGLGFAKVSPFFLCEQGLERILYVHCFYRIRSIMQIFSTNLAQHFGVNPSVETVWNKHTWWFIACCSSPRLCCFSLIPGW